MVWLLEGWATDVSECSFCAWCGVFCSLASLVGFVSGSGGLRGAARWCAFEVVCDGELCLVSGAYWHSVRRGSVRFRSDVVPIFGSGSVDGFVAGGVCCLLLGVCLGLICWALCYLAVGFSLSRQLPSIA